MRHFFILHGFLLLTIISFAQNQAPVSKIDSSFSPRCIVKYSPTSLYEMNPVIQFAYEHQLTRTDALQVELGYITSIYPDYISDYSPLDGYRIRAEYRRYKENKIGLYWAADIMHKRIVQYKTGNMIQMDGAYWELTQYTRTRNIQAIHAKIGIQPVFWKRLAVDVSMGLGIRQHIIHSTAPNSNNFEPDFPRYELSDGIHYLPSMYFGVKIGWVFFQ